MDGSTESYNGGEEIEEDPREPLLGISSINSKEIWLIQWPIKEFKPSDLHGKELKVKLHSDGKLGSLETSSGKSYDIASFAAQGADASVFLPNSKSKVVGKLSRRVCLSRFPEPDEFEQPSFANPNHSSRRGSGKSSSHRSTVLRVTQDTFAFAHSTEEMPQLSKKKKRENDRSGGGSSHASGPESNVSSLGSGQSHAEKSKKKKKKDGG